MKVPSHLYLLPNAGLHSFCLLVYQGCIRSSGSSKGCEEQKAFTVSVEGKEYIFVLGKETNLGLCSHIRCRTLQNWSVLLFLSLTGCTSQQTVSIARGDINSYLLSKILVLKGSDTNRFT